MSSSVRPSCKNLVLDAGPLLTLSPLRGLAEKYLTVPQVLDELKDRRAREHFEQLGLSAGVQIEIRSPDAIYLNKVIESAKKTGDYSVLSHADLCVLALTLALDTEERALAQSNTNEQAPPTINPETPVPPPADDTKESQETTNDSTAGAPQNTDINGIQEDLSRIDIQAHDDGEGEPETISALPDTPEVEPTQHTLTETEAALAHSEEVPEKEKNQEIPVAEVGNSTGSDQPLYGDPSDEDDGEGEWITPSNVAIHKSRALDLLPSASANRGERQPQEHILAGCMTADFAMQNVLLQMGLNLVGTEGKRIQRVKTWVLRCHACFKICKDTSKKFCPSCGNPTLLRTSVTIASPDAGPHVPAMQVHLKKNFQYRLRGTIYSIPAPKPGSAKTGTGDGLILREDQAEYMRAQKMAESKRARDERRMMSGALAAGAKGDGGGVRVGSWMDPDWMPEMVTASAGGKGRTNARAGEMPVIGHGKRNPNERRRRK